MKLFKREVKSNEEIKKTTFNDFVDIDNDVTFLSYLDTVNKIEQAIRDNDDDKISLYILVLRDQEKEIENIIKFRLSEKYKIIEDVYKILSNVKSTKVTIDNSIEEEIYKHIENAENILNCEVNTNGK